MASPLPPQERGVNYFSEKNSDSRTSQAELRREANKKDQKNSKRD